MNEAVSFLPLIGILVIVIGFVLRFNAILVVLIAVFVTALLAPMPLDVIFSKLGEGFVKTRALSFIIVLPLATIGLLERNGLKERAQNWIAGIKQATTGRLLTVYLLVRELSAALGLTSLGGHPQMVRPLIAPMAEGAAQNRYQHVPDDVRNKIRAMSAATDNVGLFFGEDIFVAFGAIVLMQTFMQTTAGIDVEPLHIAFWGIPTAICAFLIHSYRLHRFDHYLHRTLTASTLKN